MPSTQYILLHHILSYVGQIGGRDVLYMHTASPSSRALYPTSRDALLHMIALRSGLAIHLIDL